MAYGLPYMGSKNKIAKDIINILPAGRRLVDLFGGGGAISHCAAESGKWDTVLYNDINPLVVQLLRDAIAGKYNPDVFHPEWISRERFFAEKEKDGYIKYCWSFGSRGTEYIYGRNIEEKKRQLFDLVVNGTPVEWLDFLPSGDTIRERRLALMSYIRKNKDRYDIQNLERLERLLNLERLERLQNLERLEINNIDYKDYQYTDGDIVYCDIPYENKKDYCKTFDHAAFYIWAMSRPYPVYFSSYYLERFKDNVVWQKKKTSSYSATNNSLQTTEYVYKVGGSECG